MTAPRSGAKKTAKKAPRRGQEAKPPHDPAQTAPPAAKPIDPEDVPRLVADLVLAGLGKDQVRAFLIAELNLRPGRGELDKLIDQAKLDLAAHADHYREIATELTVVRLNDLYTRALKVQDLKTALDVQKAIVAFLIGKGVAAPKTENGTSDIAKSESTPASTPPPPPKLVGSYADVMERKRRRRA